MADKRPGSDATTRKPRSSLPTAVISAVDDLVTAAQSAAAPVPKKARRKIKKLGKQLDAVRATEAKRLRQSAKARQKAARRDRQAADAAARMASIVSTIRDAAGSAIAKPRPGATPTAKPVVSKPAKSPVATKSATPKRTAATTRPAPAARAKPAAATKSARATEPVGAAKPATTAKAATRRRTTATPATNPVRKTRSASRTPKPKPTE